MKTNYLVGGIDCASKNINIVYSVKVILRNPA